MTEQTLTMEKPKTRKPKINQTLRILRYLFATPCIVILTQKASKGPGFSWQIGKTNTGFLIAETLQRMGLVRMIGSNTHVLDGRVDFIDSLHALDAWGSQNRESKYFLFDDATQFLLNTEAMSGMAKGIQKLVPTLSKSNIRLVMVTHQEDWMVKKLTQSEAFVRGHIKKITRKYAIIRIRREIYPFSNIPLTSIKYDPLRRAEFSLEGKTGLWLDRRDYQAYRMWTEGKTYMAIKGELGIKFDEDITRGNRRVGRAILRLLDSNNQTPELRGYIESEELLEKTKT